jgi:hypothetical protein
MLNNKFRMKIKSISLLFLSVLLSGQLFSQAPKYSNEFLAIGVGARALAMSNSNVAVVNDVTSGYWNPAGLMGLSSKFQVGLMHSEYFAGIAKYDYGAIAIQIDPNSAGGFSFIRFGVDDIPNTTDLIDAEGNINYDRITTFSAADYGFIFSYARKYPKVEGLNYGANIKVIHRRVGDFARAWGFGLDLGIQYEYKKWRFGLTAKDITSTFNAWSYDLTDVMKETFTRTNNVIPENSLELTLPRVILGAGRRFDLPKKFSALFDVDIDMTFDGMRNVLIKSSPISIDPHLGLEFGYNDIIFLRGGFGNIQQETDMTNKRKWTFQPNLGVGIVIKKIVFIDYALTDIGNASIALYSNVFSLKFNINKKARPAVLDNSKSFQ